MLDLIGFIIGLVVIFIVYKLFLGDRIMQENRVLNKQEHLYDLLIDKLEYELSEIEFDNKK